MNESETNRQSAQSRFENIRERQSLIKSISDLFDFKVENNKELHEKIAEDIKKKQDKESDRQNKKEERKSKLAEMSKNVFLSTKLGKKYQGISDFIQNKKTKVEDAIEKGKNKALATGVNALGAIGGADVKVDIKDLYDENKNIDNGPKANENIDNSNITNNTNTTNSTNSTINNTVYKPGELSESQETLKDDIIQDTSDLEKKFQEGHKETLHEIKGIRDDVYDFTHKQDTSITKKTKKKNNKSGLAFALPVASEGAEETSSFLDKLFSKNKNVSARNTKNAKNARNAKNAKNQSKLSKLLGKDSKLGKIAKKIPGVNKLSKSISSVKNTGLAAKTAGTNAIKSVGKVTGISKAVSATKNASSVVKGIGKTGLRAISKRIPGLATVATLGIGAYDYATADSDKGRKDAVGGTAGGMAGAWAGGEAGAALGLAFGPGAVVMSPLLGLVGAVGGGILGSSYGKDISDFLFSDIDDSIPDEQKQNPFSFNAALENMRPNLVQELQKTKDKDKRKDIIDKINELNDKEKEVTSRDSLKSWLEDEIEEDKKSPKLKDKSEEDIAKALITSEKIPTEYRAELVDIYNKDIVGGFFSSDGNLKLSNTELGIKPTEKKKETKSEKFKDDKEKSTLSKVISNPVVKFLPGINTAASIIDMFSSDTNKGNTNNTGNVSNKSNTSNKDKSTLSKVISNPVVKALPGIGSVASIVDMFSSDTNEGNTNNTSNRTNKNVRFSKDKFLSNELINNATIKTKDTSSNMNVSNITKQLINSSNTGTTEPQIIKETLQPVVQQVAMPPQQTSDNTVSIANFGTSEQDVIASEIIGGI